MERSHSCSNFEATRQATHQQPHAAGSSDNLPQSISSSSMSHFPPNKPLRKRRKLQRQQPILMDDRALHLDMESAYAADLEDAYVDVDVEETLIIMPRLPNAKLFPSNINNSRCLRHEESFDSSSTAPEMSPQSVRQHRFSTLLLRDSSISMQSDSSRYSSVDSLLESRKPDPEAILINLGFGPIGTEDMLSRIPKRFLKPSKVPGIDTEAFVKRLQMASSLADSSALGYRGLTSSSDQPPSSIVAKIMERFEEILCSLLKMSVWTTSSSAGQCIETPTPTTLKSLTHHAQRSTNTNNTSNNNVGGTSNLNLSNFVQPVGTETHTSATTTAQHFHHVVAAAVAAATTVATGQQHQQNQLHVQPYQHNHNYYNNNNYNNISSSPGSSNTGIGYKRSSFNNSASQLPASNPNLNQYQSQNLSKAADLIVEFEYHARRRRQFTKQRQRRRIKNAVTVVVFVFRRRLSSVVASVVSVSCYLNVVALSHQPPKHPPNTGLSRKKHLARIKRASERQRERGREKSKRERERE